MPRNLTREAGFTLLELLMALSIFALIVVVAYTALGPAGEGFRQLQQTRDAIETSSWLGKQLRTDAASITTSSLKTLQPLQIKSDARGDIYVDQLTLLLREAGHHGLTLVHYKLDEIEGELVRESRIAWARPNTQSDRMILGKLNSFHVEVMDASGQWQAQWTPAKQGVGAPLIWPKALRITIQQAGKSQQWLLPIHAGLKQ